MRIIRLLAAKLSIKDDLQMHINDLSLMLKL